MKFIFCARDSFPDPTLCCFEKHHTSGPLYPTHIHIACTYAMYSIPEIFRVLEKSEHSRIYRHITMKIGYIAMRGAHHRNAINREF